MPNVTQSIIGVDLNNPSSTALFALGTKVTGTGNSEWQYCIATGTLLTGQFVNCWPGGTAYVLTTAELANPTFYTVDIGVAQQTVPQGQYVWIAKRGDGLYIQCTGTCPTTAVNYGISPASGFLITSLIVAAGLTLLGVQLQVSASTATASVSTGVLTWPRTAQTVNPVL